MQVTCVANIRHVNAKQAHLQTVIVRLIYSYDYQRRVNCTMEQKLPGNKIVQVTEDLLPVAHRNGTKQWLC